MYNPYQYQQLQQYQQMNPYMQNLQYNQMQQQLQQPIQVQQQQPIQQQIVRSPYIRLVNAQNEIKADEVPMDGTVGFFPTNNLGEIYAKSWNSMTGSIDTIVYKPVLEENRNQVVEEKENVLENFRNEMSAFKNEIFERFDKLEGNFSNNKKANNNRKSEVQKDDASN